MSKKQAPKVEPKTKKLKAQRETIRDLGVNRTAAAKVKGGLLGRVNPPTTTC